MTKYYSFSEEAITSAVEAAKTTKEDNLLEAASGANQQSCMLIHAECVKIEVVDHKVCLELPLGFGSHCFPIPNFIPDGSVGEACISICTTFGIPTGIKLTVTIAGVTIITQTFGKC